MQVIGLAQLAGYKIQSRLEVTVAELMTNDDETLNKKLKNINSFALNMSETIGSVLAYSLLGSAALLTEEDRKSCINQWQPSEATLKKYTTSGLVAICKESGFDDHYDSRDTKVSFSAISKKKGDLVKQMLEVKFDWSGYAPTAFIETVDKCFAFGSK